MSGMHEATSNVDLTTRSASYGVLNASSNDMATLVGEYGLNMDVETEESVAAEKAPTSLGDEPHNHDHVVVHIEDGSTKVKHSSANTYAAKKTVAQGMMDIALITANANQLRYLLEFGQNTSAYYLILVMISGSLLIQVGIGMALIFKGRYDMTGESKHSRALFLNNIVVIGVFMVTVINVFVASFSFTNNNNIAPLLPPSSADPPPVVPNIPALSGADNGGYGS